MNKALRALLARKEAAIKAAMTLNTVAADAGRDLSAEEQSQIDAHLADVEALAPQIARQHALIEAARTAPVPAGAVPLELPDDARIEAGLPRVMTDPQRGFAHLGQFAAAVRTAVLRPSAADQRLHLEAAAASTYANESVGADGGFLVPPAYASEILSVIESPENLFSRVRQVPVSGNTLIIPANESTAHGTNGIQAYWDSEAATMTQTKPVFSNREVKVQRVTALVPVTEESLEDSTALGAWVQMEAGEKLAFKVSDAILNGNGVGMPLGLLNSPALVTVTKETSQAANTLLALNLLKMYSRMAASSVARSVWVMNQDLLPLLPMLTVQGKNVAGSENLGAEAAFLPPGGLSGSQYGTILGRPIVVTESSPALSAAGDVAFIDFSKYLAVVKGPVKSDQSIHLWFDQNLRAFRFVFRVGGMPWLSAAIARKNGSNTLSHFVALGAR